MLELYYYQKILKFYNQYFLNKFHLIKEIDFIKLNMPQNVNIINADIPGNVTYLVPGEQTPSNTVKYISIGWSNYGEIYVVADKRMPTTLFLIFRGFTSLRAL